jgi:hypothetical protein
VQRVVVDVVAGVVADVVVVVDIVVVEDLVGNSAVQVVEVVGNYMEEAGVAAETKGALVETRPALRD